MNSVHSFIIKHFSKTVLSFENICGKEKLFQPINSNFGAY